MSAVCKTVNIKRKIKKNDENGMIGSFVTACIFYENMAYFYNAGSKTS